MANLRDLYVVDNRPVGLDWRLGEGNIALLAIRMGATGTYDAPDPPVDAPNKGRHWVEVELGESYQPDLTNPNRRQRFLKRLNACPVGRLVQLRENTLSNPDDVHLHYIFFEHPLILVPRSHARRHGRHTPDLTIPGVFLPPLLSEVRPSLLKEAVRIPQGDSRYGKDFVLDFQSARGLPLNQQLRMDYPFVRAYDPHFRGYRCDRNGHNVLTNWVVSVPLAFPSNWDDPVLARIRALQGFTHQAWKHVIWFLEGKILEEITPLALDSAPEPSCTPANVGTGVSDQEAVEPRPAGRFGLCYAGWPHRRVRIVGNYFVVGVRCRDGISWEADSPEPRTAFRSYRTEAHTVMWAQRGDARRELERALHIPPAFRVEHRHDSWQQDIVARRYAAFGPIIENGEP